MHILRHWVDPTVSGGVFRRCLSCTCQLRFAGYMVAVILTLVTVSFAIVALLWWQFDIPNGGNAICASLIAASLTLWAKPISNRAPVSP